MHKAATISFCIFATVLGACLGVFTLVTPTKAQTASQNDLSRTRIIKAKALLAVRNPAAAISELDNLKRETSDPAVHAVANVLMMNCLIELGDYGRAGELLDSLYRRLGADSSSDQSNYFGAAGQLSKSARNIVERYRGLGISPSDKNLPSEASNELDRLRKLLEKLVDQIKTMGRKKTSGPDALALLEEATAARGLLARDSYDGRLWKEELADARELLSMSRSMILSAVDGESSSPDSGVQSSEPKPSDERTDVPTAESSISQELPLAPGNVTPGVRNRRAQSGRSDSSQVTAIGSLEGFISERATPVYPAIMTPARIVVTVIVSAVVDQEGRVQEASLNQGPAEFAEAAIEAVRRTKFLVHKIDGRPVIYSGSIAVKFVP